MASEGRGGDGRDKDEYCFMISEGDRRHWQHPPTISNTLCIVYYTAFLVNET